MTATNLVPDVALSLAMSLWIYMLLPRVEGQAVEQAWRDTGLRTMKAESKVDHAH